jgi:hypothetical protein
MTHILKKTIKRNKKIRKKLQMKKTRNKMNPVSKKSKKQYKTKQTKNQFTSHIEAEFSGHQQIIATTKSHFYSTQTKINGHY